MLYKNRIVFIFLAIFSFSSISAQEGKKDIRYKVFATDLECKEQRWVDAGYTTQINEAILTLEENVSGVEEIDTVMILGMSHPMGPLHLADFIGLDVCLSILEVMYEGFENPKYAPSKTLINMVNDGKLGIKSGEGFYDYSEGPRNKKVSSQFIR